MVCKCCNYSSPRRISTKPSRLGVANGVWMAPMHSAGSSPHHRPSDFLITHDNRKHPFTPWFVMSQLFVPPTDCDQTKRIRRCPWCWDEATPSGLGVETPQAMKSAIAAGRNGGEKWRTWWLVVRVLYVCTHFQQTFAKKYSTWDAQRRNTTKT